MPRRERALRRYTVRGYSGRVRRVVVALGAVLAGCAGVADADRGPERVVSTLATALRSGDTAQVAALTRTQEPSVAAAEATNGRELAALGETLALAPVERSARVTLVDGGTLVLVRDGESWRVDRGVLGRPSLTRPVDAVVALHDALARSRILAVLSLLARVPRAELDLELTRWLDGTADPDAFEITVEGELATVTTPTGEHLQLVRESGEWHVLGF